jgi:hypothetical protein
MCDPSRFLLVVFGIGTAIQSRAQFFLFGCGCCVERDEREELLGQFQFGSECQELCFTGDSARMFGIESNASEIMTNPKTH